LKKKKKEFQRKELQRKERKEHERKEHERIEKERKELELKELQRKEHKELERKEHERIEKEKKEFQRKENDFREIQRKERERKDLERKEIQRREREFANKENEQILRVYDTFFTKEKFSQHFFEFGSQNQDSKTLSTQTKIPQQPSKVIKRKNTERNDEIQEERNREFGVNLIDDENPILAKTNLILTKDELFRNDTNDFFEKKEIEKKLKETETSLQVMQVKTKQLERERESLLDLMKDQEKKFGYEKWALESLVNRKVIEQNHLIKSFNNLQYQTLQKDLEIKYLEQFVDVIQQSTLDDMELEELNVLKERFQQNLIIVKQTIAQRSHDPFPFLKKPFHK